jgi:oxygen-independent coproporphyrinogen-3 oxidase
MISLPPLSLYIHIPWCVEKCPYCDFNSHKLRGALPEQAYLQALLNDLDGDLHYIQGRRLESIFLGGGTPSLISASGIAWLLDEIEKRVLFAQEIEITLEANPGTVENQKIADFKLAGINRFSFGVQSFQQQKLTRLGRIHTPNEAKKAAQQAVAAKVQSFNLDLMHGLPEQTLDDALSDLQTAIDLQPPHLSWYQLTIEPNTRYFSQPPKLPEEDLLWEIQEAGQNLLAANGYQQYEISGYCKPGFQCRHNLNYWSFGDYLGIGCGAHGKFSLPLENKIIRTSKIKHPRGYLDPSRPFIDDLHSIAPQELPFEYMMNRLRLFEPVPFREFEAYTGLPLSSIKEPTEKALAQKLLTKDSTSWLVTDLGHRYLNELLTLFMD